MLGVRRGGVGVALRVNLELAQRVSVGVGVLVQDPLRGMVNLVSVYVILCRLRLIPGSGGAVASYRIGIVCSSFMRVNFVLGSLGRVSCHLVSPTAPAAGVVGLVLVNVGLSLIRRSLGSLRSSAGRGVYRRPLGDGRRSLLSPASSSRSKSSELAPSMALTTNFLPAAALMTVVTISLPSARRDSRRSVKLTGIYGLT